MSQWPTEIQRDHTADFSNYLHSLHYSVTKCACPTLLEAIRRRL